MPISEGARGVHPFPHRFSITQTKKAGIFYVSIYLAAFEKNQVIFQILVLRAKMRIDKNARLQAFVQKT